MREPLSIVGQGCCMGSLLEVLGLQAALPVSCAADVAGACQSCLLGLQAGPLLQRFALTSPLPAHSQVISSCKQLHLPLWACGVATQCSSLP